MTGSHTREPHTTISRRELLRGAGALTGMALVGGGWDSTKVQFRRTRIYLPKWDAEDFTILQISDLHVNSISQFDRGMRAIHMALEHRADVIAITGDYVDSFETQSVRHLREVIQAFEAARCPVLTIFGNHDLGDCPADKLTRLFNHGKIKVLRNSTAEVGGVTIAGVDDAMFGRPNVEFLRRGNHSRSLVALWHEPDTVTRTPANVSLQLSGHSHGGEICLPGGIPIHTPAFAKNFTAGFYPRDSVPLYVSKGVATVGPFRVYCPPEISLHTIKSSKGGPPRMDSI